VTVSSQIQFESGSEGRASRRFVAFALRYGVVVGFVGMIMFFSVTTPTFHTVANIKSVLLNNVALLAIVSFGMTLAVAAGGIDLSVGVAVDIASLLFVSAVLAGFGVAVAIVAGLVGGAAVGVFNASLISGLRVTPFLATLGTLFIGRSVQQLAANGGNPVYISAATAPPALKTIARGEVLGIPVPLIVVGGLAVVFWVILERTRYGRQILAIGSEPNVAWYSGLRVHRDVASAYILGASICAVAGIVLSAGVSAYVPYSGNAFLLNAIGATFIGATLSDSGRPSIGGTLIGALLLGFMGNGLLLIGWNFYWQQVGTGALIFFVLAISFTGRRLRAGG
jgi:ribose transport system permease protein